MNNNHQGMTVFSHQFCWNLLLGLGLDSVPPLPSRNGLNAFKGQSGNPTNGTNVNSNTSMQPPQLPPRPSSQSSPQGFSQNYNNQYGRGYPSKLSNTSHCQIIDLSFLVV